MVESKFAVRFVPENGQEEQLQEVYHNRLAADKNLTLTNLLVGWAYDIIQTKGDGAQATENETWLAFQREKKFTVTFSKDGASVTRTLTPDLLPEIPDGSSDGEGGYLIPIGEKLHEKLTHSAQLKLGLAKLQDMNLDLPSLQKYVSDVLKAKITKEYAMLESKEVDAERAELTKPPKEEKK